jgi:hypothetical protein
VNTQNDCFESGIALLCGRPPIFAWSGEQCTVAVLGYLETDDLLAGARRGNHVYGQVLQ